MKIWVYLVFLFSPFWSIQAGETIACSHIKVCHLINELLETEHQTKLPFTYQGDPHFFEPSPEAIRNFLTVKTLIAGPRELHPWIDGIKNGRQEGQSVFLELPPSLKKEYPKSTEEGLSHFWLVPELYCDYREKVFAALKTWGHLTTKTQLSLCHDPTLNLLEARLKKADRSLPLILAHDALVPYLQKLEYPHFVLRGSGHHDQVSPELLKNLTDYLKKNPKVIWILEEPIHLPPRVLAFKRSVDSEIKINIHGTHGEATLNVLKKFQRLLLAELSKSKGIK